MADLGVVGGSRRMLLEDRSIDLLLLMFRRTRPGVSVGSIASEARSVLFVSSLLTGWCFPFLFVLPSPSSGLLRSRWFSFYSTSDMYRNGEHFWVELKDAPCGFCSQICLAFLFVSFLLSTWIFLHFFYFSLFVFIFFLLGLFGLLIPSFIYIGCCSSGLHHSRIFRLLPVWGRELQTRTRCDDRCRRITSARSQGPKFFYRLP